LALGINALRRFRQVLSWLLAGIFMSFGLLFLLAFHDRYWRWRDCFNELGRCYDPVSQDVYLEQAGVVWGGFAAACLMGGIFLALRALRRGA
jgi:hypothetical protein